MASDQRLIEIIDLTFTHQGKSTPTIDGVNFSVEPGEIVLIAGATGSGKSTLLNCIAGIAPSHTGGKLHGQILYQGQDLSEWSVRQRSQHLCILLQNVETQIFTERVGTEFVFGLENWNIPPNQIHALTESALEEFGLAVQRNWFIRQLSAGQKQRLLIACLLAIGQPVMLLDEPLAYLDAQGVKILLQLLKTRAKRGQSVIIIEHRLDLVAEICDRSYYFQNAKLINLAQSPPPPSPPLPPPPPPPPPFPTPTLLLTHNLSWGGYPLFPDLQVQAGETILLKGENGCGKTTLLKLLCGLIKPTTGKIEI